jgi:hypothetical protein
MEKYIIFILMAMFIFAIIFSTRIYEQRKSIMTLSAVINLLDKIKHD